MKIDFKFLNIIEKRTSTNRRELLVQQHTPSQAVCSNIITHFNNDVIPSYFDAMNINTVEFHWRSEADEN